MLEKVSEGCIEFNTMQKAQKTSFPKESVENTGLYKPVLNKLMTTHEQCVKYNFVAPLIVHFGFAESQF